MNKHDFIFQEGIWIGEGKVSFSTSPEHIHFYTKWVIKKNEKNEIHCQQQVEMRGGGDSVFNNFTFSDIKDTSFAVVLENDILGQALGQGVIDERSIAWEFRQHSDFEGFEVYELQENGDFLLHAEYISTDQHRTTIDGRVWKKNI
jgi:hypothetical protein